MTDITDRKLAEVNLHIASVAFEANESLMITDSKNVILRVNQAFIHTTGYTSEEAVGQIPNQLGLILNTPPIFTVACGQMFTAREYGMEKFEANAKMGRLIQRG